MRGGLHQVKRSTVGHADAFLTISKIARHLLVNTRSVEWSADKWWQQLFSVPSSCGPQQEGVDLPTSELNALRRGVGSRKSKT
jgi:hypothetical protein